MATKKPTTKQAPVLLTTQQVVKATGKTEMTVYNWRRGSARVDKMPHVVKPRGERHAVLIPKDKFLKWAAEHGIEVDLKILA